MKLTKLIISTVTVLSLASISFAADAVVATGKKIKMDYTLTVNNEEVETSVGKQPLEFVYGDHSLIPGLEKALEGMKVGEEKTVTVAPKDAYGEIDPKAIKEFPKSSMPKSPEPQVGMVLQAQAPTGESFPATISEIKGDKVMVDFNHPLAGKTLTFKIKVLDVSDAPLVPAQGASVAPTKAAEPVAATTK